MSHMVTVREAPCLSDRHSQGHPELPVSDRQGKVWWDTMRDS